MAKVASRPMPILLWSANRVELYDPIATTRLAGETIADLGPSMPPQLGAVALSRRSAFLRSLKLPSVGAPELRQILSLQIGQHFPVPAGELAFDFLVSDVVDSDGRLTTVGAVRSETLRTIQADLAAVKSRAERVVPVAFGSLLLAESLNLKHCAVVETTSEGLGIDIIAEGVLRYSRLAPQPRSQQEIDAEVCRTFSVAGVPCGPVVAAGGLMLDSAETKTSVTPLEMLAKAYSPGLLINIELPEAVAQRQRQKERARMRMAGILWAAAIILGIFVYFERSDAAAEARRRQTRADTELRQTRSTLAVAQGRVREAEALQATLDRAFQPAQRMTDVVVALGNYAPAGAWLTGLTAERGKPVSVRGIARQNEAVSQYLQFLSAEPRFRDVRLVFANNTTIEETAVVQFSVTGHAVGNLPLIEPRVTTTAARPAAAQTGGTAR
jgi:Tfp pilus assembly protein PilN